MFRRGSWLSDATCDLIVWINEQSKSLGRQAARTQKVCQLEYQRRSAKDDEGRAMVIRDKGCLYIRGHRMTRFENANLHKKDEQLSS